MDIYVSVPETQTAHFTLRLIRMEDAPALFRCYHDEKATALMNDDNCDFPFYAETEERMRQMIAYWLKHYGWRSFVRFAVVAGESGEAVGTIEGFGGETGVLRIDLASEWERAELLFELIAFAQNRFGDWFGNQTLVTKALPLAAERRRALQSLGWQEIGAYRDFPGYWRVRL